jgi:UDP-glucose 4-epimerase
VRALVTGGAGFIGSHIVERLFNEGHDVLAIDNLSSGSSRVAFLEGLGVELDTTDIRQERLARLVEEFKPDQIFHLAAQIDVRHSISDPIHDAKVNVIGLLRVLEGASAVGAKVLFASSGGTIYGDVLPEELPVSETAVGRPTSPYGITKRVAEDYLRFFSDLRGLSFVSLALSNVYGPRQDPHGEAGVVAIFGLRLLTKDRCVVFGDGKQTRDFVYVDDVADAFISASEEGDAETFNIGTSVETSVEELYRELAEICDVSEEPEYAPARPGELDRISLDFSKAASRLGWSPKTSLRKGLEKTVESLRQQLSGAP